MACFLQNTIMQFKLSFWWIQPLLLNKTLYVSVFTLINEQTRNALCSVTPLYILQNSNIATVNLIYILSKRN
jgi:hypothetical protein